jgi:subtilisin family serine protease
MKKGVIAIILLFFLLVISIVFSQSNLENEKVDSEVEELLEGQNEVSVIVVLEDDSEVLEDYSTSELEEKDDFEKKKLMIAEQQEEVLSELDLKDGNENNFDFELESKFSTVNGFSGEVTEEGLEKLASDPNVKKIYPNRPVSAFLSDSKNIVNASKTWSLIYNSTNITGKGEVICVIDTGVDYTHSDMGACASTSNINDGSCAKVIGGYDFINSDQNPADDHGHGTHVAGIVASTNITYRGIAPDANIVAIKSLDETGSGNTSTIVNGIDWCVNNASIFNITVISMSLGTSTLFSAHCDDSDPLNAAAIDAAIAKNVSVVVATGNAGSTTGIASPACIKNSTAVGATKKDNSMVYNRNNITDLLAPGFSITSLNYTGGIITFGGTSMATPMVAGAFALLHQYFKLTENRNATPTEIEDTLNDTGKQTSLLRWLP